MANKHQTVSSPELIFIDNPNQSVASEAFKSLRTNLLSILASNQLTSKTICFTSPETGDGSTLNCVNIAVSFAKMGVKVLLIDTDMRNPKVHRFFNVPPTPGLSECLAGNCNWQDTVVTNTAIEGLSILPSGTIPLNPTELILSVRFTELLATASDIYDYIFIDAPPACAVTDAAVISQKTLGAILVCKSGHTKGDTAKKAKHIIEQGGGKILGTILNGISHKKTMK